MSSVFSESSSDKAGSAEQQFVIRWEWYVCDQAQASPEGTGKLHGEATQMLMASAPITVLSAANCTWSGGCPMIS